MVLYAARAAGIQPIGFVRAIADLGGARKQNRGSLRGRARAGPLGAIQLDGVMIDKPVYLRAVRLLAEPRTS